MRGFEVLNEYYEAEDDNYSNRKIDDVRRNRLTLKHINKLRKQREIHNVEHANRTAHALSMYSRPASTE